MKHITKPETVLPCKCDVQPVIGSGRLQFKVEASTEPLAQSQAPGFVNTAAERSMDNQLHAATFVEEAFSDNCVLGGHRSQHAAPLQNVLDHLLRSRVVQAAFIFQP